MTSDATRLIRAAYTDETITVYQAYAPQIAEPVPAERVYPVALPLARWIGVEPLPRALEPEGAP